MDAAPIPLPGCLPAAACLKALNNCFLLCKVRFRATYVPIFAVYEKRIKTQFLGLTMLRQSRSPRFKPWIRTSAVATLEAKGML